MSVKRIPVQGFIEVSMNAVVIYESSEAARQANAILRRASDRADATTQWNVRQWRVELLGWPPFARRALDDAIEAHLLLLAIGNATEFPPELLNWLEVWAARREVQDAAMAVLDNTGGDTVSASVARVLHEFAERHGLSLIRGDVTSGEEESAAEPATHWKDWIGWTPALIKPQRPMPARGQTLEHWPQENYRGWGIND
jgi:hypothetical protein